MVGLGQYYFCDIADRGFTSLIIIRDITFDSIISPEVSCGDPGQITDATRSGTSFEYCDTVSYSCAVGYTRASGLNGDIKLTCGSDGKWTGNDTCTCTYYLLI